MPGPFLGMLHGLTHQSLTTLRGSTVANHRKLKHREDDLPKVELTGTLMRCSMAHG